MAEDQESRTEKPTAKRLEEAIKRGQFARSTEVNTLFGILAALLVVKWVGSSLWSNMVLTFQDLLTHVSADIMTPTGVATGSGTAALTLGRLVMAPMLVAVVAAILASGIQSRFRFTPEALQLRWERLDPIEGFSQIFKPGMLVRTLIKICNLTVILLVAWSLVWQLVNHPVFLADSGLEELLRFMANSVESLLGRLLLGLALIMAADYGYQIWKTSQDLRMSKKEIKEENRSSEGDPEAKSRQKSLRRKLRLSWRATIPTADVVVTNPTHFAIALKFDAAVDKAPKVVAKGKGYNALKIREIAKEFQVPIIENKPVARMLFQFCEEGQNIDARLYQAVAEILAFVYRTNRYRYYLGLRGRSNGS